MMMEGWLCPRCHKVNAPWVSQCSCEDFWRDKIIAIHVLQERIRETTGLLLQLLTLM